MSKQEFEKMIRAEVCAEDYAIIEYIYTWHPSIPNVGGKEKIAELWKIGGIGLIRSMRDVAQWAESVERELSAKRTARSDLDREIAELQNQLNRYA